MEGQVRFWRKKPVGFLSDKNTTCKDRAQPNGGVTKRLFWHWTNLFRTILSIIKFILGHVFFYYLNMGIYS